MAEFKFNVGADELAAARASGEALQMISDRRGRRCVLTIKQNACDAEIHVTLPDPELEIAAADPVDPRAVDHRLIARVLEVTDRRYAHFGAVAKPAPVDFGNLFKRNHWAGASWFMIALAGAALILARAAVLS